MKVNELMLNDWVKVKGSKYKSLCYKVDVISNFGLYDAITCGEYDFQEEDIEPIPITEDILKKNGFGVTHESDYRTKWVNSDDDWLIEYSISKSDTARNFLRIYLEAPVIQMRVPYVHELQHALRLCGLTDLADNFKI